MIRLMLTSALILLSACIESRQTFFGRIISLKTSGEMVVVTLDSLAQSERQFGSIGHGELWLFGISREHAESFIGKTVRITGMCDGWSCHGTEIVEQGVSGNK